MLVVRRIMSNKPYCGDNERTHQFCRLREIPIESKVEGSSKAVIDFWFATLEAGKFGNRKKTGNTLMVVCRRTIVEKKRHHEILWSGYDPTIEELEEMSYVFQYGVEPPKPAILSPRQVRSTYSW